MRHTQGPCGCKIKGVTLARPVVNATLDHKITYCPVHAEAPAMLAMLRRYATGEGPDYEQDFLHDARAIIARVEKEP